MIALASSILFALYFLVPQALLTFIFGKFVPLRTFVRSKLEELNEALLLLFLTLTIVYALVWYVPIFRSLPFGFPDSAALRRQDYQEVFVSLDSEAELSKNEQEFWQAFGRCSRRQGRVLVWYYVLVTMEALAFGYLARNYGNYQHSQAYRWIADTFLLPNISEWHPLLTDFTFADKGTRIRADVLCDDTLYQGTVAKYFLDKEGRLSGIILTEPRRFDRRAYLLLKDRGESPKSDDFWKDIPSAKLYIFADHISNLNLNYEPKEADEGILRDYLSKLLKREIPPNMKITLGLSHVSPEEPEDKSSTQ